MGTTALVVSESAIRREALQDPDVRLMLQVRDGDAAAFEELVVRYQNRLLTIFEHLVGSRDLAEDLTQEVFLRVYRARHRYTPDARFSTWLFTIVNNVASNARRDRARRREVQVVASSSGSLDATGLEKLAVASSGAMPTRQLDRAEMRQVVRLALGALSQRQRMAVLLNKFEHMSYADIAQAMQLNPQAVKSLLCRARYNLREILEPYIVGENTSPRTPEPGAREAH